MEPASLDPCFGVCTGKAFAECLKRIFRIAITKCTDILQQLKVDDCERRR
jgi:hypothetical protein